jgi:cyclic beta-1,2-glucan synthetase
VFALSQLQQVDRAHALFAMLNPINHCANPVGVERYRTEPYVVAADVYSVQPHKGRGGWTWYTGSAGWLYQAGLQAILGLDQRGDHLRVNPCIPVEWDGFEVVLKRGSTKYEIQVLRQPEEEERADKLVEGELQTRGTTIRLINDGKVHRLQLFIGKQPLSKEPFAA